MTRSGRNAAHAEASRNTRRNSTARPDHPASMRSSHVLGLNGLPPPSGVTAAAAKPVNNTVPITAMTQTARRNLIVTRYSTPSGQAAVIKTSEPNSTAIPSVESSRVNHTAALPLPAVEKSTTTRSSVVSTSVVSPPIGVPVGVGVDAGVVAVAASSGAASGSTPPSGAAFSTTKVITPRPSGSLSVLLTCQRAVHVPLGRGSGISTDRVVPSSSTSGGGSVTGSASQSTETVLSSPSSSAKPMTISSGDTLRTAPLDGEELTTEFSADAAPGARPTIAASATRRARMYRCTMRR